MNFSNFRCRRLIDPVNNEKNVIPNVALKLDNALLEWIIVENALKELITPSNISTEILLYNIVKKQRMEGEQNEIER